MILFAIKKTVRFFRLVGAFFPIDLLFSQIKYNLVTLFYWFFLFGVINDFIGVGIGLPYLFLSPEYRGLSGMVAFVLLGISIGGFIIAFHIYSYFQLGAKYPFIATLSRPFYKFMINNSIIPLAFVINLVINIYLFQRSQEYVAGIDIIAQISGLIIGIICFFIIAFLYFFPINKDKYKLSGIKFEKVSPQSESSVQSPLHRKQAWYKAFLTKSENRYYFYIGSRFKIKKSRSTSHYDIKMLRKVFSHNHINASIFEVLLIISYIIVGFFKDSDFLLVPASVSIMMLLTVILVLVSALFSWFRAWTFPIIFFSFLFINYMSIKSNLFSFKSYAFGLSYNNENLVKYDKETVANIKYTDSLVLSDYEKYIQTLNNWKKKTGSEKPKLIILNTSGGGLRSAMWTFEILQELDKLTGKDFSRHLQMITGASGGMIGAAYYRDLILMENENKIESRLNKKFLENMSKDLLNRLAFSIPTSDLLFRFHTVEINGNRYNKDRGYAFEEELKKNLEGALAQNLGYYANKERSGQIPTMIFTPTIINDGRRLLIGSQQHGYLQALNIVNKDLGVEPDIEDIEYLKYFKNNHPDEINFSTVLRMNATFPYIMPMVTLPTNPEMHVMDAGIRDNYGTKTTVRYLFALEEWITENTSGVIILKVRDNKKGLLKGDNNKIGLVDRLLLPFGNMYGNFPRSQDFNQDELLFSLAESLSYPVDVITFNLREEYQNKISLSWHLTRKEKEKVSKAITSKANAQSIERLLKLLN